MYINLKICRNIYYYIKNINTRKIKAKFMEKNFDKMLNISRFLQTKKDSKRERGGGEKGRRRGKAGKRKRERGREGQ